MKKICVCGSSIIFKGNRILLLFHKKLGIWMYPGGHMDENESPDQTALRETREETGAKVNLIDSEGRKLFKIKGEAYELPRPFMIIYEFVPYKTGEHEHFDMVYLARLAKGQDKNIGKGERVRLRWINDTEVDKLDTYPNIKIALHKAFSEIKKIS